MSSILAKLGSWKTSSVQKPKLASSSQSSLQISALGQVFCSGCAELDARCTARLILASKKFGADAARREPRPVQLHRNFAELEACAEHGCTCCRFWVSVLFRECYFDHMKTSLRQSPQPILAFPPPSTNRPWNITISSQIGTGETLKVVPKIQSWYKECHQTPSSDNQHWSCYKQWESSKEQRSSFRPTRLLKLSHGDGSIIRLVRGHEVPSEEHYVALSYCWGTSNNFKTTKTNEEQHRVQIIVKDLPRTIADAISLCSELEIYYLWVDALCILQDHDSAEWNAEASIMDKIYGFAAFTLAISSSADSNEGFRHFNSTKSQNENHPKATLAHNLLQLAPKTLQDAKRTCPLDSRGWTFQEERLSPRILHWTAHGVFWTCLSKSQSCFRADVTKSAPFFEDFKRPSYQEDEEGIGSIIHIDTIWSRLIETYSTRQFQRMEDRLSALSGLAQKYAHQNEVRYLAGHWQSSLHSTILWVVGSRPSPTEDTTRLQKLAIAPSWSWASVPSEIGVKFPRRFGASTIEWKGDHIRRKSKDEFGAIDLPGRLKLKARLRPLLQGETLANWPKNEFQDDNGHAIFSNVAGSIYALDRKGSRILLLYNAAHPIIIQADYNIPETLDQCYCLEVNKNGLLLLKHLPNQRLYERIGCANWHEDIQLFDGSDATTVELI